MSMHGAAMDVITKAAVWQEEHWNLREVQEEKNTFSRYDHFFHSVNQQIENVKEVRIKICMAGKHLETSSLISLCVSRDAEQLQV